MPDRFESRMRMVSRKERPTSMIQRYNSTSARVALALVFSFVGAATAQERALRDEFAVGMTGDDAAFDRAMKRCEAALATNPKDAEALVWHGAGTLVLAGRAFMSGNFQQGGRLWGDATYEMDEAVAIAPDDASVRIIRGTACLESSRQIPAPDQARALLEKGVGDYEKALAIQSPALDQVPVKARGHLLFGLADGWERLGDREKARAYFRRVTEECKGSGLEAAAAKRLAEM
jgi:tetratricopeptide (TPR) repeat protein